MGWSLVDDYRIGDCGLSVRRLDHFCVREEAVIIADIEWIAYWFQCVLPNVDNGRIS